MSELKYRAIISDQLLKDTIKTRREHEKLIYQSLDYVKQGNLRLTAVSEKSENSINSIKTYLKKQQKTLKYKEGIKHEVAPNSRNF